MCLQRRLFKILCSISSSYHLPHGQEIGNCELVNCIITNPDKWNFRNYFNSRTKVATFTYQEFIVTVYVPEIHSKNTSRPITHNFTHFKCLSLPRYGQLRGFFYGNWKFISLAVLPTKQSVTRGKKAKRPHLFCWSFALRGKVRKTWGDPFLFQTSFPLSAIWNAQNIIDSDHVIMSRVLWRLFYPCLFSSVISLCIITRRTHLKTGRIILKNINDDQSDHKANNYPYISENERPPEPRVQVKYMKVSH